MILSIESSCDDSSIALTRLDDRQIIFHKKISQDSAHAPHGGVVPELASRLHAVNLPAILEQCRPYFSELKAIAVTHTPGLSVTLLEGVMMAKALAISLKIPLIGVNHLKGHLYSLFLEKESTLPVGVLLVSGGHTMILEAYGFHEINILGQSMDDSFGESFDKVGKMLDLGYPGGPIVESYAREGDSARFPLTIPLQHHAGIAFSFSGLKNAMRLAIQSLGNSPTEEQKKDLCASFQATAIAHLIQKCRLYFKQHNAPKQFAIVGGASANLALRSAMERLCCEFDKTLLLAPLAYCQDNAAMIGRVALESYQLGEFTDPHTLAVEPRSPIIH